MRAAPTGLILSNECAPSVPLRSTLGHPESAPTALGFRQLACQTESHSVRRGARAGAPPPRLCSGQALVRLLCGQGRRPPHSMRPSPASQRTNVAGGQNGIINRKRERQGRKGRGFSRADRATLNPGFSHGGTSTFPCSTASSLRG